MPPLFIAKGKMKKAIQGFNTKEAQPGSSFVVQSNAWIEDILVTAWFDEVFQRNCGEKRPQMLLLDSHHSHETLQILEKAKKNNIIVWLFHRTPPTTCAHWTNVYLVHLNPSGTQSAPSI